MISIFLFAQTWYLIHIQWMQVLGIDAWLALATLSALPWLLLAVLRMPSVGISAIIYPTFAVVTIEGIRSVIPWGGFPWGLLAYGQLDGPIVELARVGGSSLVSGAVVATSAAIAVAFQTRRFTPMIVPIVLVAFSMALPNIDVAESMTVTAIQGNVPRTGLDLTSQREAVFNNHVRETEKYLAAVNANETLKSDLIVWPESSTDNDPIPQGHVRSTIDELVNDADVPLLVGAVTWNDIPRAPINAGILWMPETGPDSLYAKNHLVPFGEYIPMRDTLTKFISRLEQVPVDYLAGTDTGIFEVGGFRVGDVICFEVAYGGLIRQTIADGAQIIAVQTNNATYGNTNQPEQQFEITRFRAIEHQRPFVVASTSGISGIIDHSGKVVSRTEQFVSATVTGEVATVTNKSFTDRVPMWSAIVGIIGYLVMIFSSYWRPDNSRNR